MKSMIVMVTMSLIAGGCLLALSAGADCAPAQTLSFTGMVKYITLEGGFWGIVSEDGKNYEPINLADEFRQDGLQVQVEAVVKNRAGIHMWGTIIDITTIGKVCN